ncbi:aminoglycoside adenylyltransferase domain-containing protein [Streptococcus himalayensis]|uniref:Streptomycin 3''-adenylyltransferase n=1 Tax=Streptococcus himalayensis TaxID=1888195 RepID=A0A917EHR1_9STRE|nr:aminoglycoside adenylyltransferase domain-containing protein [Streptococcus himalayensis]GGE36562.1 streptomycin 3''-adenylyltransferase [Streptococcus himalayensis]
MTTIQTCLKQLQTTIPPILGDNILGIYIHGSYALDDFYPNSSDLDYLILVKEPLNLSEKLALMQETMNELWPLAPAKKLEFHVLLQENLQNWERAHHFDFHFSPYHLNAYLKNPRAFCTNMNGVDQDLWTHITVAKTCGITLFGIDKELVLPDIPPKIYLQSILTDIETAETDILEKPIYTILNLCRTLAFVEQKLLLSKTTGGHWALNHQPQLNQALIQTALKAHTKSRSFPSHVSPQALQSFALACLEQIREKIELC